MNMLMFRLEMNTEVGIIIQNEISPMMLLMKIDLICQLYFECLHIIVCMRQNQYFYFYSVHDYKSKTSHIHVIVLNRVERGPRLGSKRACLSRAVLT